MRKQNKSFRMLMAVLLTFALALCSGVAVFADAVSGVGTVTKVIPVNGTINPLIISITHPATVTWNINPNAAIPFSVPNIEITNNTNCPVDVFVSGLVKDSTSTLPFTDTAFDAKDWANLNLNDSRTYLALGLKIKPEGSAWHTGFNTATRWAADAGSTMFGTLNTGSTGIFEFDARHGLAFDTSYVANHTLEFTFDLS
jgi:hypothetical protein